METAPSAPLPPPLQILYQDESLVVIDKPSGVHVHPPEDGRTRLSFAENALKRLRAQIEQYLYPVHRLDPATSGVLVFALSSQAASRIQAQFREGTVQKRYWALTRGQPEEDSGTIDRPLRRDGVGTLTPAVTDWRVLGRAEAEWSVGRFPRARYAWIEARPRTGVYHQIRRHLAGASRPILGDRVHGDGLQTRVFEEKTGVRGLCLRAVSLELLHPWTGSLLRFEAPPCPDWERRLSVLGWQSSR